MKICIVSSITVMNLHIHCV